MLLTSIIPLFLLITIVYQISRRALYPNNDNAFDKESTHFLKGLCAIIVVMVHFPADKTNPLQDAIGSFAYIAVTFFFFVSAYGMQYSIDNNPNYLKKFWRNRLGSLLVPMLIVNVLTFIYLQIGEAKPAVSAHCA